MFYHWTILAGRMYFSIQVRVSVAPLGEGVVARSVELCHKTSNALYVSGISKGRQMAESVSLLDSSLKIWFFPFVPLPCHVPFIHWIFTAFSLNIFFPFIKITGTPYEVLLSPFHCHQGIFYLSIKQYQDIS